MLGLGFGELILLLIIGAIFIGPKELPGLLKAVSKFARQVTGARDEWVKTLKDDPSIREITESVDEVRTAVQKPVMSLEEALREELAKQEAALQDKPEEKKS